VQPTLPVEHVFVEVLAALGGNGCLLVYHGFEGKLREIATAGRAARLEL